MKPHPRIRKTIKWGGAALTVLLVVVWIGSIWTRVQYVGRNWHFAAHRGALFAAFWHNSSYKEHGWHVEAESEPVIWIPKHAYAAQTVRHVNLPVWIPALAIAAITLTAFRLDTLARRRARMNLCPKCHYDRTGLPGGAGAVCPECGSSPA